MSMFIHINLLDEGTVVPGVNLIVFLFLLINKTTCFLWERRKKFILRQHKYRDHNSLKEEQVWSTSAHMSVWRHIPFVSRKFRKHFPTQAPPTGSQSESDLSRAGAGLEKHGNIHSVRWITVTLMSQFSIIHCSHMETETQLFWQSNNKNRTQRIQKKNRHTWHNWHEMIIDFWLWRPPTFGRPLSSSLYCAAPPAGLGFLSVETLWAKTLCGWIVFTWTQTHSL